MSLTSCLQMCSLTLPALMIFWTVCICQDNSYPDVLSKWEFFIKIRAAFLLSPSFITQGWIGARKAALILMKHSHFDRTPQYNTLLKTSLCNNNNVIMATNSIHVSSWTLKAYLPVWRSRIRVQSVETATTSFITLKSPNFLELLIKSVSWTTTKVCIFVFIAPFHKK